MAKNNRAEARSAARSGASVKQIMAAGNVSRNQAKNIQGRVEARSAASSAASTGNLMPQQVKALQKAGVSKAAISNIKATNNQYQAAANASTGNQNINTAIDNQFNSGLNIGREFYNSPGFQDALNQNLNSDGTRMSEAQVAKYAMEKGYGLGDKYMAEFGASTQPRKASNFRQAVKLAASNDPLNLLTRKEARGIYDDYKGKKNLDSLKFTGILDKMNANFDAKGRQQIGLGGGALNLLYSGKLGNTGLSPFYGQSQMVKGQPLFGTGNRQYGGLSGVLRNMDMTGKFNRGDTIYGQYSTGQFKDSPGAGIAWKDSKWAMPETVTYQPFAEPSGAGNDVGTGEVVLPEPPPEEETPDANQFGAGSDIASFAAGWKSRKGLRAKAGRGAQGFASMRIAPQTAGGIGTNFG